MSLELIIEPAAEHDILDGFLQYEERLAGLGSRFMDELETAFGRIIENPRLYQEVESGVRRAVARVFPYLVFYAFDENAVYIVAVIHAAQDPRYIEERLGA